MTSSQELPDPASSGQKFLLAKSKQTKVGEAMRSTPHQASKIKHEA